MLGALKEDALKVVVTRDGNVYLREYHIALEDLPK
jgi:hypothetical protein